MHRVAHRTLHLAALHRPQRAGRRLLRRDAAHRIEGLPTLRLLHRGLLGRLDAIRATGAAELLLIGLEGLDAPERGLSGLHEGLGHLLLHTERLIRGLLLLIAGIAGRIAGDFCPGATGRPSPPAIADPINIAAPTPRGMMVSLAFFSHRPHEMRARQRFRNGIQKLGHPVIHRRREHPETPAVPRCLLDAMQERPEHARFPAMVLRDPGPFDVIPREDGRAAHNPAVVVFDHNDIRVIREDVRDRLEIRAHEAAVIGARQQSARHFKTQPVIVLTPDSLINSFEVVAPTRV